MHPQAERTAERSPTQAASRQYVGFQLDGQRYAFRIDRIREIVNPPSITRIPEVPAYVEGVCNLRGAIIPIVNLRLLFGLPARPVDADTRTIVATVGQRTIGCTVDAVSHVLRIPDDQIQPPPDTLTAGGARHIEGLARIGADICIILDAERLLDPDNLDHVHLAIQTVPPPS